MTSQEIEVWTRRIVDAALSGQQTEDSSIELKSEWIESEKAAHQLAAHANAVGGTRILWIIGVDEKRRGLTNPTVTEKSNWWARVTSYFDGFPPALLNDVNLNIQDKSVVALYFDTEQGAPYVVRCGTGGSYPQYVVPWREGTAKRAARRHELLRILVPRRSLADLKAELDFNLTAAHTEGSKTFFRQDVFEKAMSDGSIAALDESLRGRVVAAYISIGHANRSLDAAMNIPPLQDLWPGFSREQAQAAVKDARPLIEAASAALANVSA